MDMILTRLKQLRWSQRDLARETGFSQNYINMCMNGKRRISIRASVRIGSVLRIDPLKILQEQNKAELAKAKALASEERK